MSGRSRNANPKASSSKFRPPEPSSSPPPPPPPAPRPPSFGEEADFIQLEGSSDDSGAVLAKEVPVLSMAMKGKQKATENAKKRKSDTLEDPLDSARNVRNKRKQSHQLRSIPWMKYVKWEGCLNAAEMLHREVEAFYRYLSPTEEEHSVREMIIRTIRDAIVTTFPDATITPFGSFETRLYLPMGDIDLVLVSREVNLHDKRRVLQLLASVMKRADITNHVTIIAKARVPIIKFVTRVGKLSVDISINQETGVLAGSIVNQYLDAFPAARRLILLVKAFLKQREINEVFTGGLGSYSTVLLVVSFLQMHPKVRRGEIDPIKNLGVLSNEFLEFYGKYFNYHEVGISVLDGGTYFSKKRRGWGKGGTQLSVEDPCDTANDVAAGSFAMHRVKNAFSGANDALTLALLKKAQNLIDLGRQYYEERDGGYYRHVEPDYHSILGSIVGITDEVIHHRQLIQSVWSSGTLHKLFGEGVPSGKQEDLCKPPSSSKLKNCKPPKPSSSSSSKRLETSNEKNSRPPLAGHGHISKSISNENFSMDQELDMELSEGEIIYVVSESEEEMESRCSIIRPERKKTPSVIYISDEERIDPHLLEDGYSSADSQKLPVKAISPNKRQNGAIKLDRKREYWSSKASTVLNIP